MRSIFFERPDPQELRRKTSGWRQLQVWLPALVMIAVIAVESTDTFSAEHTKGWIQKIVERLTGTHTQAAWDEINHRLRKTGHFIGYGLVCLAFLRGWLLELGRSPGLKAVEWHLRCCVLAVGSTAIVASLDEWHQTYIPSRTGTPIDVLLDSCGATVSCVLVWVLLWRIRRSRQAL